MKKNIVLVLIIVMMNACSHQNPAEKRKPANFGAQIANAIAGSAFEHLGVIGPNGDVILYYKRGDFIIVKNCDPNTILGQTPEQAEANCHGKANKVPVAAFKQALRNLVSTDKLTVLKPLTPDEVQAYNKKGPPSSDELEEALAELEQINGFITAYGAENANLVRKAEFEEALRSNETSVSAIKKINDEIEKAVNFITDQTKLALTKFDTDKDKFLYTVLKNFTPTEKYPCGLKGSVEDRMKDCAVQASSKKDGFILVTRTKAFNEIYFDEKSKLLWSDRLADIMTYIKAKEACKSDLAEVVNVKGLTWRLPSIEEYEAVNTNGIRSAMPNMNYWFWSSSLYKHRSDYAWLFDGKSGATNTDVFIPIGQDFSVRCVAVHSAW